MKKRRNSRGQFTSSYRDNFNPLVVMMSSFIVFAMIKAIFAPPELLNPYVSHSFDVQAHESIIIVKPITPEPTPEPKNERERIEHYIINVFGKDAKEALKIAKCESHFVPHKIGDTHIMSYDSKWGEMVGDSVGVFQIRTGGAGWNRARANGMSTDQFRTKLQDYKYNINYAKTVFDREGWNPWYNCQQKVL